MVIDYTDLSCTICSNVSYVWDVRIKEILLSHQSVPCFFTINWSTIYTADSNIIILEAQHKPIRQSKQLFHTKTRVGGSWWPCFYATLSFWAASRRDVEQREYERKWDIACVHWEDCTLFNSANKEDLSLSFQKQLSCHCANVKHIWS